MCFIGALAFVLLALADNNDRKWHRKELWPLSTAGLVVLALAVIAEAVISHPFARVTGLNIVGWVLTLLFAALEYHVLFGALPVKDSYAAPGEKRPVCTGGAYSCCRHPGFISLCGLMLGLYLASALSAVSAVVYSVLNLLLILFEDICVFPSVLDGYDEYKKNIPMLIPGLKAKKERHRR